MCQSLVDKIVIITFVSFFANRISNQVMLTQKNPIHICWQGVSATFPPLQSQIFPWIFQNCRTGSQLITNPFGVGRHTRKVCFSRPLEASKRPNLVLRNQQTTLGRFQVQSVELAVYSISSNILPHTGAKYIFFVHKFTLI